MTDLNRLETALRKAHDAGDTSGARTIAAAIRQQIGAGSPGNSAQVMPGSVPPPSYATDGVDPFDEFVAGQNNSARAGVNGMQSGVLFDFDDEIAGVGRGLKESGGLIGMARRAVTGQDIISPELQRGYERGQKVASIAKEVEATENPKSFLAGEIAGGLASAGGAMKSGATLVGRTAGKGLLAKTGAGVAEGGVYGGIIGAGSAEQGERLSGAATGAAIGAATGGVLEGGSGMIAKRIAKGRLPKPTTAEEFKEVSRGLYNTAKEAGVTVKPEAYRKTVGKLVTRLQDFGVDRDLQPRIYSIAKRVAESIDQPLSLPEVDNLRKMAVNVTRDGAPSERAAAGIFIEAIDDLVADHRNWSGSGRQALNALHKARQVWRQGAKQELVEEAVFKAENGASGIENGLRVQFRQILNNKKKRRMFSKDELADIQQIVKGTTKQNIMKLVGKLGYGAGGSNSWLGGTIGVIGGGAVAGPVGSAVVPAVGYGAQRMAINAGKHNVKRLQNTITSGGTRPVLNVPRITAGPALVPITAQTAERRPSRGRKPQ